MYHHFCHLWKYIRHRTNPSWSPYKIFLIGINGNDVYSINSSFVCQQCFKSENIHWFFPLVLRNMQTHFKGIANWNLIIMGGELRSHFCACYNPGPRFPTLHVVVFFCVFSELKWELIVCFVDNSRIVGDHLLNWYLKKNN